LTFRNAEIIIGYLGSTRKRGRLGMNRKSPREIDLEKAHKARKDGDMYLKLSKEAELSNAPQEEIMRLKAKATFCYCECNRLIYKVRVADTRVSHYSGLTKKSTGESTPVLKGK
jgi:hypothetical protein